MDKAMVEVGGGAVSAAEFNRDQVDLIKRTVAKGTTDEELRLFLYTAKRVGLDPLTKQIHAVKRWSSADNREVMSIQTGIDGYRLVADRTGKYAPGKEPLIIEKDGKLVSATAYVKKYVGGEWHEVSATAYYEEYVQKKKDGNPNAMWNKMPKLMLAKCAEALALRKAFPAELSGLYTFDEMGQAGNEDTEKQPEGTTVPVKTVAPEVVREPVTQGKEETSGELSFIPAEVKVHKGTSKKGKPYVRYGVVHPDGKIYGTLDEEIAKMAEEAKQRKLPLSLAYMIDRKEGREYCNVIDAFLQEPEGENEFDDVEAAA